MTLKTLEESTVLLLSTTHFERFRMFLT